MTELMHSAVEKLDLLAADEQDRIARWLLDELPDEAHWNTQFADSQNALSTLACEVRTEIQKGSTSALDIDKL